VSRRGAPAAAPLRPARGAPARPAAPPEPNGAARSSGSAAVNGSSGAPGSRAANGAGNAGHAAAGDPEPASHGAAKAETIEECLLRSLEQYFADLDGAKPHALHDMVMQAVERPLLRFALTRAAGNQSAAAELLGINRNTLRKKMLDYRLV
jgi:Fis family transcriptional regulator